MPPTGTYLDDLPQEYRPQPVARGRTGTYLDDLPEDIRNAPPAPYTEDPITYLGRRAVPFLSAAVNISLARDYAAAVRRRSDGNASEHDLHLIADTDAQNRNDSERDVYGQSLSAVAHLPAIVGEAIGGGAALRGIGIGATAAPSALSATGGFAARQFGVNAANWAGRTAAQTAVMPSMWAPQWTDDNIRNGRDATDPRGLPPAVAMGFLNTAVLGSLGAAGNSITTTGVRGVAGRLIARTATGMIEQQGVDTLASAVSEVLPEAYRLNTGYGLIGHLVTHGADKDFWKHAITQAVTFAAFSALHEVQSPHEAADHIRDVLDEAHRSGATPEEAAQGLIADTQERMRSFGPFEQRAREGGPEELPRPPQGQPESVATQGGGMPRPEIAQIPRNENAPEASTGTPTAPGGSEVAPPEPIPRVENGPSTARQFTGEQLSTEPTPSAMAQEPARPAEMLRRHLSGDPAVPREAVDQAASLTPQESHVFWERILNPERTLAQIGGDAEVRNRATGKISRARVAQIEAEAFEKMGLSDLSGNEVRRRMQAGEQIGMAEEAGLSPEEVGTGGARLTPEERLSNRMMAEVDAAPTPEAKQAVMARWAEHWTKELEHVDESLGTPAAQTSRDLERISSPQGSDQAANEPNRARGLGAEGTIGQRPEGAERPDAGSELAGRDAGAGLAGDPGVGRGVESYASYPVNASAPPPPAPPSRVPVAVQDAAKSAAGVMDAVQRAAAPASRGELAAGTSGNMREELAINRRAGLEASTALGKRSVVERLWHQAYELATGKEHADAAMGKAHDLLESSILNAKTPAERNAPFLAFTDAIESGDLSTLDPRMRPLAEAFRKLQDARTKQLADYGIIQTQIDNYMSHLWKAVETPGADVAALMSRRPLAGSKYFAKKRSLMSYREGIEGWTDSQTGQHVSLEPVSWNPVDLMLLSFHQMDKAIMAHRVLEGENGAGRLKFVPLGGEKPADWVQLNDPSGTVYAPPTIPMTEFFDVHQREALDRLARNLGIDVNRVMRFSKAGEAIPKLNEVNVAFGTGHDVLAHEIGHIMDKRYGLAAHWTRDYPGNLLAGELRDLASMRHDRIQADPAYEKYVQSGTEKIANLVAAYLHAPEMAREIAPHAVKALETLIQYHPELKPLAEAKPSMVLGKETQERRLAGPQLIGHWYGPEQSMTLINNHLTPSIIPTALRNIVRDFGGMMNNFQLGFSGFHAGFVFFDTQASSVALGLQMLSQGEFSKGAKQLAISPTAPFTRFVEGNKILKEYYQRGSQGAETAALLDAMIAGGMSAKMDKVMYGNDHLESFRRSLQEIGRGELKSIGGALWHALPGLSEAISVPTMEIMVPRMKIGVMAEMTRHWMERNPGATIEQKRVELGKLYDSVENRLGQMTYDNIFWNRTMKDVLMMGVRSVGWNLGTWRELGGGVKDLPESARGLGGKGITSRTAYLVALPMVTAFYAAIYQYLNTGKGPEETKDYFFPKTGRTRPNGSSDRVSLPSYMRDIAALTNRGSEDFPFRIGQNMFTMGKHKLQPLWATTAEMLDNQDYYGTAIVDPSDPYARRQVDRAMHLARAFQPFSFRGPRGQERTWGQLIQQQVGITPAPGYVVHTAEQEREAEQGRRIQMTPLERLRRERLRTGR